MLYRFARREVEVRLTPRAVEILLKGERIAAHLRASGNHRHTTVSGGIFELTRQRAEAIQRPQQPPPDPQQSTHLGVSNKRNPGKSNDRCTPSKLR